MTALVMATSRTAARIAGSRRSRSRHGVRLRLSRLSRRRGGFGWSEAACGSASSARLASGIGVLFIGAAFAEHVAGTSAFHEAEGFAHGGLVAVGDSVPALGLGDPVVHAITLGRVYTHVNTRGAES